MFPLRVRARAEPSRWLRYAAPLAASLIMFVIGGLFLALMGKSLLLGWQAFVVAPLASREGWSELLLKASPLLLIALGLAPGFRSGVWNIGAEGQLIVGALAAAGLAIALDGYDYWWILPAMVCAAALAGAAWAAIPALLRTRFNTSEILVSLMLVYVASFLMNYLVYGPFKDPHGMGFPQSILFADAALFSPLFDGYRLNTSVFLVAAIVPVFWIFLQRSFLGYQLQVGGLAPHAAAYAGFSARRSVWISLLIGGSCAGVAGAFEVAGPLGQLTKDVSNNYGFGAIIIAFLGRLHPFGIVLASLLMSALYLGGEKAQVLMDLPSSITSLFQGLLLFLLLACDFFVSNRIEWQSRHTQPA